jgi:hypothetical protein
MDKNFKHSPLLLKFIDHVNLRLKNNGYDPIYLRFDPEFNRLGYAVDEFRQCVNFLRGKNVGLTPFNMTESFKLSQEIDVDKF